jgi:hypothetical protein
MTSALSQIASASKYKLAIGIAFILLCGCTDRSASVDVSNGERQVRFWAKVGMLDRQEANLILNSESSVIKIDSIKDFSVYRTWSTLDDRDVGVSSGNAVDVHGYIVFHENYFSVFLINEYQNKMNYESIWNGTWPLR